jgi:small-conductance mechanosensitive channel
VNPKSNQPWIPLSRIESAVQIEPALVIIGIVLISWIIYKTFLKNASAERHKNLMKLFVNVAAHLGIFVGFFALYVVLQKGLGTNEVISERMVSYFGLMTMIAGSVVFVKACRILLFEYLFIGHMKEGVPVLLVNIFTLILSIGIGAWIANEIFGIRLTPILATSAIFSLVLGLALQDTLGNLFAGVALQLDKPYEIGDWIEVMQNGQKWIGQVQEITWRATTMIGLFDEHLIIPNRVISQAEIANFSSPRNPIWRNQTYRIPFNVEIPVLRKVLKDAVLSVPAIRRYPEPLILFPETTESWILVRCSYTIDDYGKQWAIGTEVNSAVIQALQKSGLAIAAQRIQLVSESLR